ncbi:MAG: hypothetical protein V7782_05975 [Psychromonas sp.]
MKTHPLLIATVVASAFIGTSAFANYDSICDDTLGYVVEGAVVGGAFGVGVGAIADGADGAKRGAAIGAGVGAIDGLVEGAVQAERCQRDMEDLEGRMLESDLEDAIIDNEIDNAIAEEIIEDDFYDDY